MNTHRFQFAFVLVLAGVGLAIASERDLPGSKQDSANSFAPEPGQPIMIRLGRGEMMRFVWIKSLNIWVGQFEVTNGQYRGFHVDHKIEPYHAYRLTGRNYPVVSVSWYDACNYCAWLNRKFGHQLPRGYAFRLPTEKEWETFASCGDKRIFPWGNQWPPPDDWNYRGMEGARGIFRVFQRKEKFIRGHNDGFIVSCPVERSGANDWFLYGVGGNVWEWCGDWFDREQTTRVLRGAAWSNYQQDDIAVTNRNDGSPSRKSEMVGFRVVIGPVSK